MRRVSSAAGSMGTAEARARLEEITVPRGLPEGAAQDPVAWEMVEAGRYMPRRIRGSFRGRELG